jgi:2-dehydro-3-deoxyphosphogluconate aldolase / (4S)-4-hydroxy-2-oxoglutarate aldolase
LYRWEITRAALAQRVFAIVRGDTYEQVMKGADTLLTAGIEALEISLSSPFALDAIGMLRRETGDDAIVGAGAVLDAASARTAVDAGARFLASPGLDAEVIRTGHRHGLPVFPGVVTPTEMIQALELGADALKLFPASGRSPAWLRDVRAALPQAPLLPTGGVTLETAPEWIAAGAVACGMGSAFAGGDRETTAKNVTGLLQRLEEAASAPSGEERARRPYAAPSPSPPPPRAAPKTPAKTSVPAKTPKTATASKTSEPSKSARTPRTSKTSKGSKGSKTSRTSKSTRTSTSSTTSTSPDASSTSSSHTSSHTSSKAAKSPASGGDRGVRAPQSGGAAPRRSTGGSTGRGTGRSTEP